MAKEKLNTLALGYAAAIISGAGMRLLSRLANIGIYTSAAEQVSKWHMFYSVTIVGTITGVIEAAIISFGVLYAIGGVANTCVK